jgi:hypothetical protein
MGLFDPTVLSDCLNFLAQYHVPDRVDDYYNQNSSDDGLWGLFWMGLVVVFFGSAIIMAYIEEKRKSSPAPNYKSTPTQRITTSPVTYTSEKYDAEVESHDPVENQTTNVNLTIDSLTQPECIISGKATFSDGKSAAWYIDKLGRLGLNPDEEGYNPPQEDLEVFQNELRNVLSKEGL